MGHNLLICPWLPCPPWYFQIPPTPSLISWLRVPSPQSLSADKFTIYYTYKTTNGTTSKFCLQPSSYFCICFHPFLLFCRWNGCLISYLETIIPLAIIPFSQCLQIVCTYDLLYNNLFFSKCACLKRAPLRLQFLLSLQLLFHSLFSHDKFSQNSFLLLHPVNTL